MPSIEDGSMTCGEFTAMVARMLKGSIDPEETMDRVIMEARKILSFAPRCTECNKPLNQDDICEECAASTCTECGEQIPVKHDEKGKPVIRACKSCSAELGISPYFDIDLAAKDGEL